MILIELNFLCGGIHMDFDQIITSRRSIRFFSSKPVAPDLLTEILTLANYAPSWSDSQPWQVYLAQGETLAKIKAAHQKATAAKLATSPTLAPMRRRFWEDFARENMHNNSEAMRAFVGGAENLTEFNQAQTALFNAPVICYLTIPQKAPDWSLFDLGLFSQSLTLAAKSRGVDSIIAYELIKYTDQLKATLQIPDSENLIAGIALGYRDSHALNDYQSPRRPLAEFVHTFD